MSRLRADYSLVIDADDELEIDAGFVLPRLDRDAYRIRVTSDVTHERTHLFNSTVPWRYVGVVHEWVEADAPVTEQLLDGLTIRVHLWEGARSRDPNSSFTTRLFSSRRSSASPAMLGMPTIWPRATVVTVTSFERWRAIGAAWKWERSRRGIHVALHYRDESQSHVRAPRRSRHRTPSRARVFAGPRCDDVAPRQVLPDPATPGARIPVRRHRHGDSTADSCSTSPRGDLFLACARGVCTRGLGHRARQGSWRGPTNVWSVKLRRLRRSCAARDFGWACLPQILGSRPARPSPRLRPCAGARSVRDTDCKVRGSPALRRLVPKRSSFR